MSLGTSTFLSSYLIRALKFIVNACFTLNFTASRHYNLNMSSFSFANHSILPLLLKIPHPKTISYILRDTASNSLLLFPSQEDPASLQKHIKILETEYRCRHTHTFLNSHSAFPKFKGEKVCSPENTSELIPNIIGNLSVCYIKANGYRPDYNMVGVTHFTSTSTKIPVLFLAGLLTNCSIDYSSTASDKQYLQSLKSVKFFPNDSFIFPSSRVNYKNLIFSQKLADNESIQMKIAIYNQKKQDADCLIPTTVAEEKLLNPFMRPDKYKEILMTAEPEKSFQLLRKMGLAFNKQNK